jgi:hypothetical protein
MLRISYYYMLTIPTSFLPTNYYLPVIPFRPMRMQAKYVPSSPKPTKESSHLIGAMSIHEDAIPLSPGTVGNIMHHNDLTPATLSILVEGLLTTINK